MDVTFTIEDDIVVIIYTDVVINSDARFDEWYSKLIPQFEAMLLHFGSKYPIAVDTTGLTLHREFGERYSRDLAVVVAEKYASAIARFGKRGRTKSVIAIEAMRRVDEKMPRSTEEAYSANIFRSKADALHFLKFVVNR